MPAELCTLFIKPLRFCYQNIRPILPSLTKSTKYGRNFFYSKNPHLKFVFLCRNQVTWKIRNLTLKSREQEMGFAIMFKCMSGFITDNGKYIMPLQEKLSYYNSVDRCNSFGFKNHSYNSIPQTAFEATQISSILKKDLDYRFILPKTKMNRSSLIPWLLTPRAGLELNLIIMKLKQMIHFKVRLDVS